MNIQNTVKSIAEALFYFAVYFVCQFAIAFVGALFISDPLKYTVELSAAAAVLTVAVYFIIFTVQKRKFASEIELSKISPALCALMPIFGAAANVLMSVVISAIPFPDTWMDEYNTAISAIVSTDTAVTVIFTALLAPICEEIVLRGLVHTRLRKALPTFAAMLISSWIFGMMHGIRIQIIYAALLGLVLAWIFEKTGSLSAPILFHIGFNTCGLVIDLYKWNLLPLVAVCLLAALFSAAYIQFTSKRKIHFARKN